MRDAEGQDDDQGARDAGGCEDARGGMQGCRGQDVGMKEGNN